MSWVCINYVLLFFVNFKIFIRQWCIFFVYLLGTALTTLALTTNPTLLLRHNFLIFKNAINFLELSILAFTNWFQWLCHNWVRVATLQSIELVPFFGTTTFESHPFHVWSVTEYVIFLSITSSLGRWLTQTTLIVFIVHYSMMETS